MTNEDNIALIAATVHELTDKVLSTKYINSIELNNEKLAVLYSDDSRSSFDLPIREVEIDVDALESKIMSFLRLDIEARIDDIAKSIFITEPLIVKGEQGEKGQDADQEYIINEIKTELLSKLKSELLIFKDSIPVAINGKDVYEESIKNSVLVEVVNQLDIIKNKISDELNLEIRELILAIPVAKDGRDGKDADESTIVEKVADRFNNLIESTKDEISEFLKEFMIARIREIQDSYVHIVPLDGKDGKDGKDADEDKILSKLSADIDKKLYKSKSIIKSEINHGLQIIKESIPIVKDGVDGKDGRDGKDGKNGQSIKGDKGDKGDDGNGIISAEIDNRNHLLIETNEKWIDAGKLRVKNSYGGGGGGFDYTNTAPTPFDVGGIKQGSQFKNVDLKILITRLLYGCALPTFASFAIKEFSDNPVPNNVEIGYTIQTGFYNVEFEIQDPELLQPDSIVISQSGYPILENLPNISPVTLPISETIQNTIGSISFEILAYDTTGVSFSNSFLVNYKYKIYYGEYTEDITDSGLPNVLAVLRASELVNNIYGEYLFLDIAYKWFCYPEILGENYVFYDIESDISIVFDDVKKITITNDYGLEITYNCYRTLNEISTQFIMGVK
jgi:hypothetical protein